MWNQITTNSLTSERERHREHFLHQQKLLSVKSCIDNRPPLPRPHLDRNARKQRSRRERSEMIQKENQMLLSKMLAIDMKPSQFSAQRLPRAVSASSLHRYTRNIEHSRISEENRQLRLRMQSLQSYYNTKQWEQDREHTEYLLGKLSENSGHVPRNRSYLASGQSRPVTAGEVKRPTRSGSARDRFGYTDL